MLIAENHSQTMDHLVTLIKNKYKHYEIVYIMDSISLKHNVDKLNICLQMV